MDWYVATGGMLLGLSAVGGAWKALRVLSSIQKLIDAQLKTNGGGSLVDKANRIPSLTAIVQSNHSEALHHWKTLEAQSEDTSRSISEIKRELWSGSERMERIEGRIGRIEGRLGEGGQ